MKKVILSLFVLLLNACAGYNSTNDAHIEDENGRKLLTTHKDEKEVEEERISYEEFTNQNPNFLNTTSARTSDYEKMREVIEAETPYRLGDLKVNGRDAWVTVHTGKNMSQSEKKRAQEIAVKELFEGLPRFHFHVNAVR
jgi:hypothetical protein